MGGRVPMSVTVGETERLGGRALMQPRVREDKFRRDRRVVCAGAGAAERCGDRASAQLGACDVERRIGRVPESSSCALERSSSRLLWRAPLKPIAGMAEHVRDRAELCGGRALEQPSAAETKCERDVALQRQRPSAGAAERCGRRRPEQPSSVEAALRRDPALMRTRAREAKISRGRTNVRPSADVSDRRRDRALWRSSADAAEGERGRRAVCAGAGDAGRCEGRASVQLRA